MMMRRNSSMMVMVVVGLMALGAESTQSRADAPKDGGTARLQEIQRRFLDAMSNSTSSLRSAKELMGLLHSDAGQEMGRLLVEGLLLGARQRDSGALLGQFWEEVRGRLSPELLGILDDYRDFFAGMDVSTLPLVWEQLFRKDELGNSLAGLPLGQLVDLVQPAAARYGVDIRTFVDSLMGRGDDNARDLILSALGSLDVPSLLKSLLDSTSNEGAQARAAAEHGVPAEGRSKSGERSKRGKDKTLRLFRPLVASLLRENRVDLDPDAVLEVLSPVLNGDVLAQIAPLLASLGTQAGGGLMPVVASLLGGAGGGGGQQKQQQTGGLLGGLGTLLAGGGGDKMDIGTMVNLASMLMDGGKPSKKDSKKTRNREKPRKNGLDLGKLVTLASHMAERNDIDVSSVLGAASSFLNPGAKSRESHPKAETPRKEKLQPAEQAMNKPQPSHAETTEAPKLKSTPKQTRPRNLIDVVEPIILSMQTDKACNRKIKDAITFGRAMLSKKISSLGDLERLLPLLTSAMNRDALAKSGLDVESALASAKQALAGGGWNDFLEGLEDEGHREALARGAAPHAAELAILLAREEVRERLYDAAVPGIQAFLASYGLAGVTLGDFPERMAPMVGLLAMGWDLPFEPVTILVPLRDYLKGVRAWATDGLAGVRDLSHKQVEGQVMTSLKEALDSVMDVVKTVRGATDECLPQLLCHLNQGLQPNSLQEAVTRTSSLVLASGPALEASDSTLLVKITQAISGNIDQCKDVFPGDCAVAAIKDNSNNMMNLDYEHQEL